VTGHAINANRFLVEDRPHDIADELTAFLHRHVPTLAHP